MARRERKPFGQRLIASMSEGLERLRSDEPLRTTVVPVPPAPPEFRREELVELRARFGMTQAAMAAFVNVSEKTLESWEQGSRSPNGAALRLLQVIGQPEMISDLATDSAKRRRAATKEAATRPHRRERILLALLLELIRTRPGLPEDQYSDALGDATRMRHHMGALAPEAQDALAEILPKVPKQLFSGKAKRPVSFASLVTCLLQLGYIEAGKRGASRVLRVSAPEPSGEHVWLAWTVPGFAELVWRVSDGTREASLARRKEVVEV